jgi:hypothetical protein
MMRRIAHIYLICLVSFVTLCAVAVGHAQDKPAPAKKAEVSKAAKAKIPIVRVTPRIAINELPNLMKASKRPVNRDVSLLPAPPPLTADARVKLLEDSGITVSIPSAPDDFRLSPRQPYASSVAYLLFSGEVEFNPSSDTLLARRDEALPIPTPRFPGFPDSSWGSAGPQPDPPAIVGVLMRMEAGSRYLADFSVSSDAAIAYQVNVTGAEGTGSFTRESGGQHVLVALEASRTGYVSINISAGRTLIFHNVVLSRIG